MCFFFSSDATLLATSLLLPGAHRPPDRPLQPPQVLGAQTGPHTRGGGPEGRQFFFSAVAGTENVISLNSEVFCFRVQEIIPTPLRLHPLYIKVNLFL